MSRRKLAVIMDPIEGIKPHKDTSFALLLAAQERDWEIHCGELQDIWLRDGEALGRLTALHVDDDPQHPFDLQETAVTPLSDIDVILMRKDPPFDLEYIVATYVLERAEDHGAVVVNRPQALRDANEKVSVAWFSQCAPPTLVSRCLQEMRAFISEHHKVVVKPLHLMGGKSIFVTDAEDNNCNVILETVSNDGKHYTMLQKFLPEVRESGDRRIILIAGEPVPMALARIPSQGDHRGNIVAGAQTEVTPLTDRELWICEQIGPTLRDKGLDFVGIDVIGGFLTEINVTSPTGIRELERATGIPVAKQFLDEVSKRL